MKKSVCEVLDLPHMFSSCLWTLFHIWTLLSSNNDVHVCESWPTEEKLYQEKIVNGSNKTGAIRKDFLIIFLYLYWWHVIIYYDDSMSVFESKI